MANPVDITKRLKKFSANLGVDIIGIADLEKVPEYFPPRSPQDVMKGAKYAIIYGQKMLWGSIETSNLRIATAHTMAMYNNFYLLSEQIGSWLESYGYKAAILNHYLPFELSVETKGLSGDLSLKHLAMAAGLGTLGKSKLVLTKKFGPRVRFAAVLTTGELVPDQPEGSAKDFCKNCNACIKHCPQQAIKEDGTVDVFKCLDKTRKYGLLYFNRYVKKFLDVPAEELRKSIKEALKDPFWWNLYQELETGIYYGCFECLTHCPAGEDYKIFKGSS
jgi:epoxyqueuosine reductase QueG